MTLIRFLMLAGLVGLHSPLEAFAEATDVSSVMVHIRAVRALEKVEPEPVSEHSGGSGDSDTLQIDTRIRDLADKLEKLHFRNFHLISSQREVVQIGKRQNVALVDGNQLTLRPLTLDDKRISMWIKWQDGSGMQVLDTRMHFDCGESVVTGVEQAADTGLILAIDVSPIKREPTTVQPVAGH